MLKRILAVTLSAAMIGAVLTGCSNDKEPGAESKMKLTFLNSKGEIQDGLEAVAKEYKKKTGVDIEILVAPAGTSPSERFSQLYNSGTPPTMSMLDTTDVVDIGWDKAVDLTGEKWVADAGNQAYRINDKVYSFPMGVEVSNFSRMQTRATPRRFSPSISRAKSPTLRLIRSRR